MPTTTRPLAARSRPAPRELAAAAFGHACAVLGESRAAEEAAVVGVRHGGRSLPTVLGHTRDAALARARSIAPLDLDAPVPDDLAELARRLTFTRPPVERAVVDLDTRYDFDRAALGRALGLPPAAAAARTAEVLLSWQRELDPVLLAHLGPGSCDALAEVLEPREGDTSGETSEIRPTRMRDLLEAGERTSVHVDGCDVCRDRLRAMVSVRTLLAREAGSTPPEQVHQAAAVARMRPSGPPPPLAGGRPQPSRRPVLAGAAAAIVVALALGAITARPSTGGRPDAALTTVAAADTALAAIPSEVDAAAAPTVVLRSLLEAQVEWRATSDRPWLVVHPPAGSLAPGGSSQVVIALQKDAPEGDVRGTVTFTGADGSTAIVRVRSHVSRAPDIAADLLDCHVSATVQDESELESVLLVVGGESATAQRAPMRTDGVGDDGGWTASVPPGSAGQLWRVVATDAFGNTASTPGGRVPPDC